MTFNPSQVPIKLTFSLDEINTVVGALGHMPYGQVCDLIGNIKGSTLQQIAEAERLMREADGKPDTPDSPPA